MKYRALGNTNLELSTVSLGCWAFMGGDLWGNQEQHELDDIVAAALDLGINLFDMAEGYGDGRSGRQGSCVKHASGVSQISGSTQLIFTSCTGQIIQFPWRIRSEPLRLFRNKEKCARLASATSAPSM